MGLSAKERAEKLQREIALAKARTELLEQRHQAVLQQIDARESTLTRKRDTRRKIVIGGTLLALARDKKDGWTMDRLRQMLDAHITAERDRVLLDLPPKTASLRET